MAQDWDGDGDPREFCYRVLFKRNTVQENYTEEGVRALCGTLGIAGDLRHLEVVNRKRKNHGRDKTSVYAYFDSGDAARLLMRLGAWVQPTWLHPDFPRPPSLPPSQGRAPPSRGCEAIPLWCSRCGCTPTSRGRRRAAAALASLH